MDGILVLNIAVPAGSDHMFCMATC